LQAELAGIESVIKGFKSGSLAWNHPWLGMSGPYGTDYGMQKEVEDLNARLAQNGRPHPAPGTDLSRIQKISLSDRAIARRFRTDCLADAL